MSTVDQKTVAVVAVIVTGLLLAGAAGVAYFSKQSVADEIQSQQAELETLQQQLESTKQAEVENATKGSAGRCQLLAGPEVVITMQKVQSLADAAGISIDGLKAIRSAESGKQSFALSGHGQPRVVCDFLAAIEVDDRLMIVETGRLLPAGEKNVAFELGLATYHGSDTK